MKNSTKLRIINWVEKILKYKDPIIIKKERDIMLVRSTKSIPKYKLVNKELDSEFIKTLLITDLIENLSKTDFIQFEEISNIYDQNIVVTATLNVATPIKDLSPLKYLK